MALPYRPDRIEEAGRPLRREVVRIQAEEFPVTTPPKRGSARSATCGACVTRKELSPGRREANGV